MTYVSMAKPQSKPTAVAKKTKKRPPVSVQQTVKTEGVQPKLKIGEPNDKYEQEADRVADQVMRMPESQVKDNFEPTKETEGVQRMDMEEEEEMMQTKPIAGTIQRMCTECEEEKLQRMEMEEEEAMMQTKSENGGVSAVTPNLQSGINRLRQGGGVNLPPSTKGFMESRFGHDFSGVKIHTGPQAATLSKSVNARAFTVGRDIFFNQGEFQPNTPSGMHLLAHEMVHTIQQERTTDLQIQRFTGSPEGNPFVIMPDGFDITANQMNESEFLEQARTILNQAGQEIIQVEGLGEEATREVGLGDLYVDSLIIQSQQTASAIETLVSETVQSCESTAQGYLFALERAVPNTVLANRTAIEEMQRASLDNIDTDAYLDDDIDADIDGGFPDFTPPAGQIRSEFPEISQPLAAGLTLIPSSIWGVLRPLLQGLIFHSIISAGYVVGKPSPPHPLALVNRGGGTLGRRRTDLRDPATSAVIEIKPEGDTGGVNQLQAYITTLNSGTFPANGIPWHAATAIPVEEWPITPPIANYTLNPFGINFTLQAWNVFATEPGMIYYRLVTSPGLPVYVPVHSPQPRRRFNFDIPRVILPEFDLPRLPSLTPQQQVAVTTTVGGGLLLLVAATLVPIVPPPP